MKSWDDGQPAETQPVSGPLTLAQLLANHVMTSGSPDFRYIGGKTATPFTVTSAGWTDLIVPAVGEQVVVFWCSAYPNLSIQPGPDVKFGFGPSGGPFTQEVYRLPVVGHWEVFVGAVDEVFAIDLSAAVRTIGTIHHINGSPSVIASMGFGGGA